MRATSSPLLTALAAAVVSAGLAACADAPTSDPGQPTPPPGTDFIRSALERDRSPDVSAEDLATFAAGQRAFAFDLYQAVADEPGNVVLSPYSVISALGMTYAGAAGQTADELAAALHLTLEGETRHAAFNALDLALTSRGEGAMGADGEPFRLRVVNSAWAEKTYTFLESFLDTLAVHYGAGIFLADFVGDAETQRERINAWVAQETEDRIPDLLPEDALNADTRLVLVNAVYFNASWASQFEPSATRDAPFLRAGGTVDVPTMFQSLRARSASTESFAAVELPYDGGEVAMLLVTSDDFVGLEESLSDAWLAEVDAALAPQETHVYLPRFEYRVPLDLVEPLKSLGVVDAFDPARADLSGMDGTRALSVGGVVHEAFIKVDETGTEAAAATAVTVGVTSAPLDPIEVRLDRPFIYIIRDVPTGAVLFVGRVLDPSA